MSTSIGSSTGLAASQLLSGLGGSSASTSGNTTTTTTDADGSVTTTVTDAKGSVVSTSTTAAKTSSGGAGSADPSRLLSLVV